MKIKKHLMVVILFFFSINACSYAIVQSASCLQTPPVFQQAMATWVKTGLGIKGFQHWVFYRGTLFAAGSIWWKSKHHYRRAVPHEGVDFYYYQNKTSASIQHLKALQPVPLIYAGKLVTSFKDFIGRTYIFSTQIKNQQGNQFYILYAHMRPIHNPNKELNHRYKAGAILFTINTQQKTLAPSHLHISTFWLLKPINPQQFSWDSIDQSHNIILVNPLLKT